MLTIYDVANYEEIKSLVQGCNSYNTTKNFIQHINNVSKKAGEILEVFRIS